VAFNVLHAAPTAVARFVAAIPPTALGLSFELLMRQLRQKLKTNPAPNPPDSDPQLAGVVAAPRLDTQHAAHSGGRQSMLDKARHIHADQERHGTKLTGKTLAALLGISDGYARRLLRDIDTEPAVTT
jgi:hypothetical protein